MIILTTRTDKLKAELGLYDGQKQVAYETWEAHRKLAETIHQKIDKLLSSDQKKINDVEGIVAFQGPGSFTGLRIGLSVANALAYSLSLPVAATKDSDWIKSGIKSLLAGRSDKVALPEYGAPVHTTTPRK